MSDYIQVYTKYISDDLIPKIISKLNEFEMTCEIDPSFSFSEQDGVISFKFLLINPPFDKLKGKVLKTSLELYIENFDLEQEKKNIKKKGGLISRLFGKTEPDKPFINPDIDIRIKDCKKLLTFVMHGGDSFVLRFASLTSAIITELTNGVCGYPANNEWYENENFIEKTWQDIIEYETKLLKERDLNFHEFVDWQIQK